MLNIEKALGSVVSQLSDQNYEQSLRFYRLWLELAPTYTRVTPSDLIFDTICSSTYRRTTGGQPNDLIVPTAPLILRFATDLESDHTLASYTKGLQNRLCSDILHDVLDADLGYTYCGGYSENSFYKDVNLIAHCANLGYIEEATIRGHILQPLISHPEFYDHQANALYILFKIAGATFCAYVNAATVDRCFELLEGHRQHYTQRWQLIEEVIQLRERGWDGLPPPPIFPTRRAERIDAGQNGLSAAPVATPLGLSNTDVEHQIPQSPAELFPNTEDDIIPESPITLSPSISTTALSDFTIADTSDEEPPTDPTAITPDGTFNFEDGNVEMLCGNTLFRVHTSILSLHSPALRRMFAQTSLAEAESPIGCPRIQSPDTATDFATLLKTIYLPGFPKWNKALDFNTFSSLLRMTAKYEMPDVRSQLLEVVRDAYPETFEGVTPTKPLGETAFSGPTPHPNEVLNLFVQQKLTSALPMAYYMAAQRGLNSLMDRRLPKSATLPPEVLQPAIEGLMALREMEREETHRLIFEQDGSVPCSTQDCLSRTPTTLAALEAYKKVFGHIVSSSQRGTKVLQVPGFYQDQGGEIQRVFPDFCRSCVNGWNSGHANLRQKAWASLQDVFGLKN